MCEARSLMVNPAKKEIAAFTRLYKRKVSKQGTFNSQSVPYAETI